MNSDAMRARNARKRAKLRAKERGQTLFAHLYLEVQVVGCNQPACLPSDVLKGIKTLRDGLYPTEILYHDVLCSECTPWYGEPTDKPHGFCYLKYWDDKARRTPLFASESIVLINGRAGLSSALLESSIVKLLKRVAGLRKGTLTVFTAKLLENGQEVIERWQGTTEDLEVGAAEVIAALSQ